MPGSSSSISFATLWILQKTLAVDQDVVDNVVEEGVVAGLKGAGAGVVITVLDTEKNHSPFTQLQSKLGVLSMPMNEERLFLKPIIWLPQS
jgi:hypothetical protein